MKHLTAVLSSLVLALTTPVLLSFSAASGDGDSGTATLCLGNLEPLSTFDGTECIDSYTVESPSSNVAESRIRVVAEFEDGTTQEIVLQPGQSHIFKCDLVNVTAQETAAFGSVINWLINDV